MNSFYYLESQGDVGSPDLDHSLFVSIFILGSRFAKLEN